MDELLQSPRSHAQKGQSPARTKLRGKLATVAEAAGDRAALLQLQGARVYHRAITASASRKRANPLAFLALSLVVGAAGLIGTLYTPSVTVEIDGVNVGAVRSEAAFEEVVSRVESRVSGILERPYTMDSTVAYSFALTEKKNLAKAESLESYLFAQVDEVMKGYVLTVDGETFGAATSAEELSDVLDAIAAPYVSETTVSVTYDKSVNVALTYAPASTPRDLAQLAARLSANTSGQTNYEVKQGDGFMAIAMQNDMTMAEMQALNPEVNVDKIYVGQLLNVKEAVPFLSVTTTDVITYNEPIASAVREVPDATMYTGTTKVLDAGIPGEARMTANVMAVNGREREREITATVTLREPTEKVVAVGTMARPSWLPTGNYMWPVSGYRMSSTFGYRSIFGSYSYHSGLDLSVPYGTPVKASDGGTVAYAGFNSGGYGNLVIIDHGNGERTYYGHNSSLVVNVGDKVYQGQLIAKAGSTGRSTGNHCHFEIRINGTAVNPRPYLS